MITQTISKYINNPQKVSTGNKHYKQPVQENKLDNDL